MSIVEDSEVASYRTRVQDIVNIEEASAQIDEIRTILEDVIRTVAAVDSHTRSLLAYEMVGLFQCSVVRSLAPQDGLVQALDILGQLELPSHHREAGASWEQLGSLVSEMCRPTACQRKRCLQRHERRSSRPFPGSGPHDRG